MHLIPKNIEFLDFLSKKYLYASMWSQLVKMAGGLNSALTKMADVKLIMGEVLNSLILQYQDFTRHHVTKTQNVSLK